MTTEKCKLCNESKLYSFSHVCNLTFFSRQFYDRRMGQEINGDVIGEEYNGYVFRLTGGNDKQGFPMKQGILINGRTRILFKKRK